MININLVPKQYLKRSGGISLGKHGIYALAGVCGIILMLGAVSIFQLHQMKELNGQMEIARSRTAQLENDIRLVDALIDIKAKITDRMQAVERLDRHRSAWVRLLEDLSRNIPEFVWLSSFAEIPEKPVAAAPAKPGTKPAQQTPAEAAPVTVDPNAPVVRPAEVEGFTFTLNALASFMIKMMRSNYFEDIDLVYTKEVAFGKQKAYNFKLSCNVHYLSDEELENMVAQQAEDTEEIIN